MARKPEPDLDDDEEDAMPAGPIAEAVAKNLTQEHIDKFLGMTEKIVESWSHRGFVVNKTRLAWNYLTLIVVTFLLGALTWVDRLPPEALTGFLGTAIGYWLASANKPG
ncbi:MAG: hypothetical protein WC876_01590 [Candidatus Thermoplasmatota archaeon]|jgi:hypothetical protein